jgi:mannosyl-oligosaccharide glucosidase
MGIRNTLSRVLHVSFVLFVALYGVAADKGSASYDPTKPLEDPSLIWGTYRPQIYFGVRSALPESLLSGLLWFSPLKSDLFSQTRHECNEGDKLKGYGWKYHDGRSFAVQEINDVESNYIVETSWIKTGHEASDETKGHAGSWAVRIKGRVIDSSELSEDGGKR